MEQTNIPPFFVLQKVVCVKGFADRTDNVVFPQVHRQYTVRTIEMCPTYKRWMIRLVEIRNPIRYYKEGKIECRFLADNFRSIEKDFVHIEYSQVLEQEKELISSN